MIVISHSLISFLLYRQNPGRFHPFSSNSKVVAGENEEKKIQPVTLTLLGCSNETELIKAVKEGIKALLPDSTGCVVLLQDEETGKMFTIDHSGRKLWLSRMHTLWETTQANEDQRTVLKNLDHDLIYHLRNASAAANDHTPVLCSKVLDEGGKCVLALLIILGEFTPQSEKMLAWFKKQIAACYSHIQRTFSSSRAEEDKASQQLIRLCGELYDQDAGKLQLKVIKYLEEQTQAECGFILLVVPETQELFCQVIGKKVLETELRFPGHTSSFAVALETNQPMHLDDIPQENLKEIEEVVECTLQSFLCVPINSRSDNTLIALACLVNKTNANRFTERDISCVQQCFRYTATVLTSTIAFQNERRLKLHSQALLQVARHLFTNLGELIVSPSEDLDSFPWIRSRMCEVNVYGVSAICSLKRDRYVDFCNCHVVDDDTGLEWKYPFRCQLVVDREKGLCPEKLKELALKCMKVSINLHKNLISLRVKRNGMSAQQSVALENRQTSSLKSGESIENHSKGGIKDSACSKKKSYSSPKKSPKSKSPKATTKGFFGGWMFYRSKEAEESDSDNNDDERDTTLVGGINDCLQGNQMSPQSVKSDSQGSCISYHTANSVDTEPEIASQFDKNMDGTEENYFDSWEFMSSSLGLGGSSYRNYLADMAGGNKQSSSATLDKNGSHEIYVEDLETGQSHLVLNTSQMEANRSFSLDEVLDGDSGLGSVTRVSSKTESPNQPSQTFINETAHIEETSDLAKPESESRSQDEEVITTVSSVDLTGLQVPETELVPLTQNDLTKLLREIMQQARNLTHAERCSVFLIDKETDELVAKVFDGIQANDNENEATEIRMPSTQGIAGHVATSGELLNIRDAYSHPLFYRGIDDTTGFKTRNILCFPIKDGKGTILGVAQLCNKMSGPYFTIFDEDVATAFGIYCCISINHSVMYKKVMDSQVRSTLANELMMYHMKCLIYKKMMDSQHRKSLVNEILIYHMQVCPNDVQSLMTVDIPHPRMFDADFVKFSYAPRLLPEDRTTLAILSMFEDLGFISRWRIKRETLARFVLMVKKGYRNPPYHNWMHAYTVGQFCYQLIRNLKLEKDFDEIELFSLFVSCLCHDIDHRGTTNAFQISSKSVLAALYSSEGSVLERHHFAQTMCILNTEGCNVFENLDSKEYQQILDLMRDNILATDLQHHFDILPALKNLADKGFDKTNLRQRKLLLCLLMTSCDLSDQTKPWENAKGVAAMIYKEFFSEGDMEKARGNRPPSSFDRERVEIPTHQISFIEKVAMPVYKVLADIFPSAMELVETVEENQAHWEKISNLIKLKKGGSCAKMTFEEVLAMENEAEQPNEINHNEFNSENGQQSVKS